MPPNALTKIRDSKNLVVINKTQKYVYASFNILDRM